MHFNDSCCGSIAELRSIILKARRLADDHAEQEQAAQRGEDVAARSDPEKTIRAVGGYRG
ncbi:MAG: hypothetical protein WBX30_31460 [Stellaceae bacterium]